ncbi:hypothetical protein H6F90_06380 [Trichocoleus sp. FACHB-591]|uniref:hypothetical protein n=1 Tax=Trichocoleus sp. FACHB-591 TaxID=2692872 RepID=UPI001682B99E|nr:hypothetical protein [Trichocoleus sp. FACHB-591]MBD2094777.1 hypothetical protein [Trichocoleus sp. FACHB-591]
MFAMNWRCAAKGFVSFLVAVSLVMGLVSCGDRSEARLPSPAGSPQLVGKAGKVSEVSPPEVIQTLRQSLEKYQPQVSILSPRPSEVLQDNTVSVRFQVTDLPLFKDAQLGLGPHLHVILDNEPYEAVYNAEQPLILKDVAPGSHTLRVFASRPWHESFKNEGAYAQTTFHVFTKTQENTPDLEQPLLTYSRPKGEYGAEPIMLDFYLTNTPLHLVAQEEDDDDISDWRIRCTINGESFIFDRWQPLYLKGFQPGKNWVQLELLDEKSKPIGNAFNNTVRLITYELNGQDTLSKLVRGEISAEQARGIVDPNYKLQIPAPEPEAIAPVPSSPAVDEQPVDELPEEQPEEQFSPTPFTETLPEPKANQSPAPPQIQQPEAPKPGGYFNRFRSPAAPIYTTPKPNFVPRSKPEVIETPEPETLPETQPEPAIAPSSEPLESIPPSIPEEETESPAAVTPEPLETAKPKSGGFFNRFRRSAPSPVIPAPTDAPTFPDLLEAPTSETSSDIEPTPAATRTASPEAAEEPAKVETPATSKPTGFFNLRPPAPNLAPEIIAPEVTETPVVEPAVPTDTAEPTPTEAETPSADENLQAQPPESKPGGFFNRFRSLVPAPAAPPAPEAIEAPEVTPSIEAAEPAIAPSLEPSVAEPEVPEPTLESKYGDIFERLHQATPAPVMPAPIVTPALPEVVVPKPKPTLPQQTAPTIRKRSQPAPIAPAVPKEVPIIQAPEQSDRVQQLREKFASPSLPAITDSPDSNPEAEAGSSVDSVESLETP